MGRKDSRSRSRSYDSSKKKKHGDKSSKQKYNKEKRIRRSSDSYERNQKKRIEIYEKGENERQKLDKIEGDKFDMDENKDYNKNWTNDKNEEKKDPWEKPKAEFFTEVNKKGLKYDVYKDSKRTIKYAQNVTDAPVMIEVICNDRMGSKVRVKCW